MKVAIYGAGGVGGYYGGRLAQVGVDVHLIARGSHGAALKGSGLTVRSVLGDFHVDLPVTDDPGEVGPCDFVLFCVKSFDTESAGALLAPMLGDDTAVISLQNGIDNEEKLGAIVGPERVMGGVAYIFATIAEPGVIEHTGGPSTIAYGELDGQMSERAMRFAAPVKESGIGGDPSADIRTALWQKFAFISAQAGMTASVRLPLGDIRATPESWDMFMAIIAEVVALARAEGIDLDEAVEQMKILAAALPDESYSSLHYDLTHGKRIEIDALHGAIVERGRRHGIDTPAARAVYAILAPWARRNAQAPGA